MDPISLISYQLSPLEFMYIDVELSYLGYLAPRMSFCPYFLQLNPSSRGPSGPGPRDICTCFVHLGNVFLQQNSKIIQLKK